MDAFDPGKIARSYKRGGAAALSVLTDEKFFGGKLADLGEAREATTLPVLRKDFTIDEYQVLEAAAYGADAILLIVAALELEQLRRLRELSEQYGMSALVEVHDEEELAAALDSGATMIGVNNRNLRTFEVDIHVALRVAERIPDHVLKIAESGIQSAEDVRVLRAAGYRGLLIGEFLMRSANPAQALRELLA